MKVSDYIAAETERQSGTVQEAIGMYKAWSYILMFAGTGIKENDIKHMSYLTTGRPEYRDVEVTFRQMSYPPVPADSVPRAMKRLVEQLLAEPFIDDKREYADYMTREFLIIHPFADGNGRVGSLLWNYLNGTLRDPEMMPYFFGEA